MKRNRLFGAVAGFIGVLLAGWAAPAWADQFDDAFNDYNSGQFGAARAMLKPLAQGGDVRAQYLLGRIYSEGEGVAKNDAEGIKWYRLAANNGDVVSQLVLGTMYVNGRGVERDLAQAYSWFTIVARGGVRSMTSQAFEVRDLIEQMMSSQQINDAEAIAAAWNPN